MIYVDDIQFYATNFRYKYWCHMWSDTSIDELHEFAKQLNLKIEWFQDKKRFPHYDLTTSKRNLALQSGATYISLKEWLKQQGAKK